MTATATPPQAPPAPPRARRPSAPLLSAPAARIATLSALGLWAAVRWSTLVEPSGAGRMIGLLLLALVTGFVVGQLSRLPPLAQAPAAVVVVLAWAGISMLVAGVPARLVLDTDNWDDLALGLQQGIEQLPQVLVPYSQSDPWPRVAILLGGALLLALGCVLGLSPGRRGVPLRGGAGFGGGVGLRLAAATPLIAAMLVPPIIMEPDMPVVEGLLLFVLLAAFLWLERLPRGNAAAAIALLAAAALGGALALPRLDGEKPWVDVQALVEGLDRPDPARFDWSQAYGPLDWPRTGREVLRVRSTVRTYWKAQNLDVFDGVRWIRGAPPQPLAPDAEVPREARRQRGWNVSVRVTVRELTTSDVLGAGTTIDFEREPVRFSPGSSPGTWVSDEPLEQGDGYVAETIVPRPRQAALRAAPADYPQELFRYLVVGQPEQSAFGRWTPGPGSVFAPPFGSVDPDSPQGLVSAQQFATGPYARTYELARQLAADAATPYDYVRRVLDHFRDDFTYSETPPRRQLPLDAFLFRDRLGYCQQFAGAAALLLRMGGVPARVSAGFTSGTRDDAREEFVVRDYDAHAWIEVWFPRIGWVRFDPTPSSAPALSGRAPETQAPAVAATTPTLPRAPELPEQSAARAAAAEAAGEEGGSALPWIAGGAALLALLSAGGLLLRHALRPPRDADELLAELERALRRTGRPAEPRLTLLALERRLHDSPDAAAYVSTLRHARFAGADAAVTARQRRALRAELARGLGLGGRLRALMALPPRWGG
ncbi:transglutaminase-like domain-containing protein [Conexibacter stalactiti]|uniref:Transglutaminase-like domain-containing protein n=1 Tax=Conexibacter stalactiti TaxID=1940611 RepID=A0ABU4HRM4_9ACTN|nr:transglutaminase-like domain-containing protein [Conexibacter stalactiti]MDW5595190.1 transglutaminase-like domain-containing protein [Conexibacter stalactiti]MEC5035832.1 transglutaminase-like domain-containing protein [Conexibacter stalactiti]